MILVRKLDGKEVISSDAKSVGEIGGAYVELGKWKITHLAVDLNDETIKLFGYQKPRFMGTVSICLPVNTINVVGDVITLNKTLDELPNLPIDQCEM